MFLLNIDNREVTENLDSCFIRLCFSWIFVISIIGLIAYKKDKDKLYGLPPLPTETDRGRKKEGRKEREEGREGGK